MSDVCEHNVLMRMNCECCGRTGTQEETMWEVESLTEENAKLRAEIDRMTQEIVRFQKARDVRVKEAGEHAMEYMKIREAVRDLVGALEKIKRQDGYGYIYIDEDNDIHASKVAREALEKHKDVLK